MNTPTPRTDAAASESIVKVHETSLQLETELTAALAEIDRLDVSGIHSCHANCQKSMCVMRRELTAVTEQRDELAESLDFQFKLNRECIDQITTRTKERDEAREQRDEMTKYANKLAHGFPDGMLPKDVEVLREANLGLAVELTAVTEQRNSLADLVKQFISILDITEESDSGRLFHPTNITSCRAGDLQKIGELVEELRRASLHQPIKP
jgi:hypothetical protein